MDDRSTSRELPPHDTRGDRPIEAPLAPTLVLLHTIPDLVGQFSGWCRDLLPEVRVLHILDEPLLEQIKQRGHGDPDDEARLVAHVRIAAGIGAAGVLVTCSTVSLAVARVRASLPIPVFAIDDAMAVQAVCGGRRIAIIATAATTLEPSRRHIEAAAAREGRVVETSVRMVDDALSALLAGDPATHDRLVTAAIHEAAVGADVVVLAQATMARVLRVMADPPSAVPVLASPHLALAAVRRALFEGAATSSALDQTEVRP